MRRLVVLLVGLLVLGAVPAQAEPDMVKRTTCSDGARSRLHSRTWGDRIKVRLKVYRSPVGHEWRIMFRFVEHNITNEYGRVFFRGTRVASDSGVFVVQLHRPDWAQEAGVEAKAVDRQTGQACRALVWYR